MGDEILGDNAEKAWRLAQHCERKINALEKKVTDQQKTITELSRFLDKVGRELMAYQNKTDAKISNMEKANATSFKVLEGQLEAIRKGIVKLHS